MAQQTLTREVKTTFWLHRPLRDALVLAARLPKPRQSYRLIVTVSNETGRTHVLKDIKLTSNKLSTIIETSKHNDLKSVVDIPPFKPLTTTIILIQDDAVINIAVPFAKAPE